MGDQFVEREQFPIRVGDGVSVPRIARIRTAGFECIRRFLNGIVPGEKPGGAWWV